MKVETLNFGTAHGETTAYVAMPEDEVKKAVILIQEYWGLNDHIKNIAERYAAEGYVAIAPDLYRGKMATKPSDAKELMGNLKLEDGLDTIKHTIETAKETYGISSFGISGYCMGGTYALRAACEIADIKAAAPFYGDIPPEDVLQKLQAPTIFFAGLHDAWINPAKVGTELKEVALKHGLPVEVVTYDADHAFFNDTRPEVYKVEAAQDAWKKVLNLFGGNL